MALQHLRSSTADKRPTPGSMSDGQLAINTNLASPGLFFKDSNGDLVKVGPVHVGATAPNVSPASGGQTGNSKGEQWLDTSSSKYVFKIWDGTAWRSESGEFVDAAGDVMTGALGIIAGTAAAPGLYISGDTNTGIYSLGADQLALGTGGTGRLFIDDGGRIMAGTSTALTNAYAISTALTPAVQIQGNTANAAALSITRQTSAAANLLLQRGVTGTPVADTEALGQISFNGFDGASYFNAALIRGVVEGTPGTGSMPGRLSLQTTPTGSTTPVERLRLDSAGQILAASLGTASLPVWSFTGDPNTGIYSPGADQLAISTAGTQRVTIDSSGRVGIGTTSPGSTLTVNGKTTLTSTEANQLEWVNGGQTWQASVVSGGEWYLHDFTNTKFPFNVKTNSTCKIDINTSHLAFLTGSAERARLDSSGRLLVGTSSARTVTRGDETPRFQVEGTGIDRVISCIGNDNSFGNAGKIVLGKSRGSTVGSVTIVQSGDVAGSLQFDAADGTIMVPLATIQGQVDGTPGSNDMPGRLVFSTTADGASAPTERMRIEANGRVGIGTGGGAGFLLHVNETANAVAYGIGVSNASFATTASYINANRAANSAYSFLGCDSGNAADREFTLRGDGTGLCDGAWTGGGADYAEYFEWSDSNPDEEDRRGISVVLDGDKIREALPGEDPIGVISGNPSVVGDAAWNKWNGKYLRDEYGTYIQEDYEVEDEDGNTVIQQRRKLNPAYDPDQPYQSREERPEWDCVGLMGKLRIRKGQVTGSRWIKMRDINDSVEEWLVR